MPRSGPLRLIVRHLEDRRRALSCGHVVPPVRTGRGGYDRRQTAARCCFCPELAKRRYARALYRKVAGRG